MTCNCKNEIYEIDFSEVRKELYENCMFVTLEADLLFGTPENIIKEFKEPQRAHELEERRIYVKEALRFMFQLSLMNPASFMVPREKLNTPLKAMP